MKGEREGAGTPPAREEEGATRLRSAFVFLIELGRRGRRGTSPTSRQLPVPAKGCTSIVILLRVPRSVIILTTFEKNSVLAYQWSDTQCRTEQSLPRVD